MFSALPVNQVKTTSNPARTIAPLFLLRTFPLMKLILGLYKRRDGMR